MVPDRRWQGADAKAEALLTNEDQQKLLWHLAQIKRLATLGGSLWSCRETAVVVRDAVRHHIVIEYPNKEG